MTLVVVAPAPPRVEWWWWCLAPAQNSHALIFPLFTKFGLSFNLPSHLNLLEQHDAEMKSISRPLRRLAPSRTTFHGQQLYRRGVSSSPSYQKAASASASTPHRLRDPHRDAASPEDDVPYLAKLPLHTLSLADLVKYVGCCAGVLGAQVPPSRSMTNLRCSPLVDMADHHSPPKPSSPRHVSRSLFYQSA